MSDFESVRNALLGIRGVTVTTLSLGSDELTLVYDQRSVKPEQLRAAVRAAGFKVRTITLLGPPSLSRRTCHGIE